MKKYYSKVLALLLALVMALSLMACSGGKEATEEPAAAEETAEETAKTDEVVELVMWHPASLQYGTGDEKVEDTFIGQAIAKYEEENNVKITIVNQPQDNFDNLFKAANIAKNGPDVVLLWTGASTVNYGPSLLPLNDYLSQEDLDSIQGWDMASQDLTFAEDKEIYGIPFVGNVYSIYYNKELFAQAGLDPEDVPETWDEFMVVCKTLKDAGITPFICGAKDGYIAQWAIGNIMTGLVGDDTSIIGSGEALSGTAFETAAGIWYDFCTSGYVNENALSHDTGSAISEFLSGNGAMFLSGNWVVNDVYNGLGDNAAEFAWPAYDADYVGYIYGGPGNNICVTNYTKHADEAVAFAKYLCSAEFEAGYFIQSGELPMNKNVDVEALDGLTIGQSRQYELLSENISVLNVDRMAVNPYNVLVRNGSLITMGQMEADAFTQAIDEELAKAE